MKRIFAIVISLCLSSAVACSTTQNVDLFRVNDNGEVVNIGPNQDNKVLYGHFLSESEYQRARLSMTRPNEASVVPVCYINLSEGEGIRIEPCDNASMINEGVVLNAPKALDVIGVYHIEEAPWGSYDLYQYVEGGWKKRFSTHILDEHWQQGIDVIRRDPSHTGRVFLTTSHIDDEGNISLLKTLVSMDEVLDYRSPQDKRFTTEEAQILDGKTTVQLDATVDDAVNAAADVVSEAADVDFATDAAAADAAAAAAAAAVDPAAEAVDDAGVDAAGVDAAVLSETVLKEE